MLTVPFIFICFFSYVFAPVLNKTSFLEPFNAAIVDCEDSLQTRMLINQLKDMEIFNTIYEVDEREAEELIRQNIAAAAVVIPDGFSESVMVGENKPVIVIGNSSMPLQSYVVKSLIQSAANFVTAGQSAINTIYHYSREAGLEGEKLDDVFKESTMQVFMQVLSRNEIFSSVDVSIPYGITPVEYYTATLIVVFLMFAGMPGMKLTISERRQGLADRLAASPAKRWQIVLARFIIQLMLSIMQFLIIVILTAIVFHNFWGFSIWRVVILMLAIIFAVSSWTIFVSSVSKTSAAADAIGNLGILLMAVVGGSIYPLSSLPGMMRTLGRFTINRWATEGFMVIFSGDTGLSITNQVIALIVIGLGFLCFSMIALKAYRR